MKKQLIALCAVIALTTPVFAYQLGVATNTINGSSYGSVGLYDAQWDASIGYSSSTSEKETKAIGSTAASTADTAANSIILEARYKKPVGDNLDMTFGAYYRTTTGETSNIDIDSSTALGLSVGLETKLTDNLILGGYYFPVWSSTVEMKEVGSVAATETTTSGLGNVVQMKATYLLNVL